MKPMPLRFRIAGALALAPMTARQLSYAVGACEGSVRSALRRIGAVVVGFHKEPGRIAVFIYRLP